MLALKLIIDSSEYYYITGFNQRDSYKENMGKLDPLCIGTSIEVQSLQLLSFLYCICHILIVVQDSLADPFLVR